MLHKLEGCCKHFTTMYILWQIHRTVKKLLYNYNNTSNGRLEEKIWGEKEGNYKSLIHWFKEDNEEAQWTFSEEQSTGNLLITSLGSWLIASNLCWIQQMLNYLMKEISWFCKISKALWWNHHKTMEAWHASIPFYTSRSNQKLSEIQESLVPSFQVPHLHLTLEHWVTHDEIRLLATLKSTSRWMNNAISDKFEHFSRT